MDSPVIDIDHEDLEGEEVFEESVFAPFGRFFDDDLFMLIYTSQGVLPANLRVLRNKLQVVSDRKIKKRSRAKAALHLGREVVKRAETRDALVSTDFSCAIKWFDLAIQLNSVEGAADVASLYLSKAKSELGQYFGEPVLEEGMSLNDLSKLTGWKLENIRHWINEGLMPTERVRLPGGFRDVVLPAHLLQFRSTYVPLSDFARSQNTKASALARYLEGVVETVGALPLSNGARRGGLLPVAELGKLALMQARASRG